MQDKDLREKHYSVFLKFKGKCKIRIRLPKITGILAKTR